MDTPPRGGNAVRLLVDNADLDPAWIEATLIPVLTDCGRIAAMSARATAAAASDANVVLARHVLTVVAERRRLAFVSRR
jgi:UDP-N-acetylglucosamine--N-acetylmuramyl-(pentapeptide) pyrophosphoryl-undecaprenol N-acetylglucosamine transferase